MNNIDLELDKLTLVKENAKKARRLLVETVNYAGAGHIGGPLSAIDILSSLYFSEMDIDPTNPLNKYRDRFVISKGHSAIGLYCILALRGYFPVEELKTFDQLDSRLQAHPDMNLLPGLDMSTGSLGQGISSAVGMALGAKLQNDDYKVFCMIGDGETQEGQVWEAADIASKYKLNNLVIIMDYNKLQQFGWVDGEGLRITPISNPIERWSSFGFVTYDIDGHNHEELIKTLRAAKAEKEKPTIIIANTIKGKGIDFMENKYEWHSKVPTDEELFEAIKQIENN